VRPADRHPRVSDTPRDVPGGVAEPGLDILGVRPWSREPCSLGREWNGPGGCHPDRHIDRRGVTDRGKTLPVLPSRRTRPRLEADGETWTVPESEPQRDLKSASEVGPSVRAGGRSGSECPRGRAKWVRVSARAGEVGPSVRSMAHNRTLRGTSPAKPDTQGYFARLIPAPSPGAASSGGKPDMSCVSPHEDRVCRPPHRTPRRSPLTASRRSGPSPLQRTLCRSIPGRMRANPGFRAHFDAPHPESRGSIVRQRSRRPGSWPPARTRAGMAPAGARSIGDGP